MTQNFLHYYGHLIVNMIILSSGFHLIKSVILRSKEPNSQKRDLYKAFSLPEPQFPQLWNWDENTYWLNYDNVH